MRIDPLFTDDAVLAEIGRRLERARLARNMTQKQLAEEAGVGERTVARIEGGSPSTLVNLVRVLRALDLFDGLDRLVPEPLANPLVELERRGRGRRRASRPRKGGAPGTSAPGWTWGDGREDA